ncbi:conserved hypothetical protein [Ricinus communis]|uniref:Uncharacterized protein n=1 Tax=Ricinus communis TaxID=3988 RepID=B9T9R3_RICCO|nr:conserved hypothetical protein [Ricinus communis]
MMVEIGRGAGSEQGEGAGCAYGAPRTLLAAHPARLLSRLSPVGARGRGHLGRSCI